MTVVLWGLLAVAAVAVAWWAAQVDWAALHDSYRTLPDQTRRGLSLLVTMAALLVLRGIALLVVAKDAPLVSIATGWLLAAVAVMLVLHWPRQ